MQKPQIKGNPSSHVPRLYLPVLFILSICVLPCRSFGLFSPHSFPSHEMACEGKQSDVDGGPSEQNAKVKADARVEIEEDGTGAFDDWRAWRCQGNSCERCGGWGGVGLTVV